jgi:hypothetical protein
MKLFSILGMARAHLRADVQACEGINSVIRVLTERAKNISLALVDARARIKKTMGTEAGGTNSGSFSRREDMATAIAREAAHHYAAGKKIMCDEVDRFEIPAPAIGFVAFHNHSFCVSVSVDDDDDNDGRRRRRRRRRQLPRRRRRRRRRRCRRRRC